jgi:hypothetical protein
MARTASLSPADVLSRNGLGSYDDMVTRILAVWGRATASDVEAGATWYGDDSRAILAGLVAAGAPSLEHAAAATSHLSPRTTWNRNVAGAYALVRDGAAGALAVGCMAGNVERAARALSSPDPLNTFGAGALKTARFARNLLGDRSVVTVDVWAARVAFPADVTGKAAELTLKRAGVYLAVESAYIDAALSVGVDATTMQATTWVVARNGRAA